MEKFLLQIIFRLAFMQKKKKKLLFSDVWKVSRRVLVAFSYWCKEEFIYFPQKALLWGACNCHPLKSSACFIEFHKNCRL